MHESTNLRRATIRATLAAGVALGLWVGVIAVGRVWGLGLLADGRNLVLYAPPLLGFYRREPFPDMRIGYVVGALAIIVVPFLARRLPWRAVLVAMPISALVWAVGLAAIDKESGLTHGLGWDNEFGRFVPKIAADPAGFLHGFVANIKFYDIQIRGHPPGFVLVLSLLERVGLQGVGWAAALVIVVGSSAVAAVLLVVRDVAGEAQARRAAPFVAIAPAALWIATSLDAFLLGVTAWSVALIVLAARRSGWRAVAGAIAGGILAGFGLMLSYGMALMVAVIAPLVWSRRDDPGMRRSVAIGTGAAAGVLLAFVPLGFFWPAGLAATREEYKILDVDRPYSYFLIANLSAWAIAVGPAIAVGLARLRDRRVWLIVGGALTAGLLADLSGMSEGEAERIWLPFTIWLLVAGASLGTRKWAQHGWVAVQVVLALALTTRVDLQW